MRKSFLKYIAYNRVILNMTFSWELVVCIQHLPCSVSFQCILGHRHVEVERRTFYIGSQGSNLFWHFKEVLKLFGPQWTKIGCTSFNFKHYLRACTPSGRKSLFVYAILLMENHRGPTPDERSYYCWTLR